MIRDWWNPTQDEIRNWAYNPIRMVQDWQLAVYDDENIEMILEFVEDESCTTRDFFLDCLYVYVGDKMRRGRSKDVESVRSALLKGRRYHSSWIRNWILRSEELLANPNEYDYNKWGLGGSFKYDP